MSLGEARSYEELQAIMRSRAEQLQRSREELDRISGLASGFCGKVLSANPVRRLGPTTIGPMLGALGIKLVVVEDAEALAKYAKNGSVRDSGHVRNGNHASKPSKEQIQRIKTIVYAGFAKQGGINRMAQMSENERKRFARLGGMARWKKRRLIRRRRAGRALDIAGSDLPE